jgi:prepilin-type N-terminal cleavage/methylation domain-containing protein
MPTRNQGFTLLEILIVLGFIGVLAAIGFPNLMAYQRSVNMNDVANSIAQSFRDLSSRAVSDSAAQNVKFLLNAGAGADMEITGSKSENITLNQDAKLTSVKVGTNNVTTVGFDVRGRPTNAATLVITVGFADQTRTIRLLPTGKTVVQ